MLLRESFRVALKFYHPSQVKGAEEKGSPSLNFPKKDKKLKYRQIYKNKS